MKYYDSYVGPESYQRWHGICERAIAQHVLPAMRVAEFGCGSGTFLEVLRRNLKVDAVGYDYSSSNVEAARARGLDVRQLDFADESWNIQDSFDACVSLEVIEHLVYPRHFVNRIAAHLKPGGVFFLSTPNAFNIRRRVDYVFGKLTDPLTDPSYADFPEHLRLFSFATVRRLLEEEGFEVLATYSDRFSSWPLPQVAMNLLSSGTYTLARKKGSA
jgi:cyclopropane fatty-acyl-phospholipid synthase-like methyltransferase